MGPEQLALLFDAKSARALDLAFGPSPEIFAHQNEDGISLLCIAALRSKLIAVEWLMRRQVAIAGNGIGDVLFWSSNPAALSKSLLQILLKFFQEEEETFSKHPNLTLAHVQAACGNTEFFSGNNRAQLTTPNPLGISPAFFALINGHQAILALLDSMEKIIQAPTQKLLSRDDWRTRALYLYHAGNCVHKLRLAEPENYWREALSIWIDIPPADRAGTDKIRMLNCISHLMPQEKDKDAKIRYFRAMIEASTQLPHGTLPNSEIVRSCVENLCLIEPTVSDAPTLSLIISNLGPQHFEQLDERILRLVAQHSKTPLKKAQSALLQIKNRTDEDKALLISLNKKIKDFERRNRIKAFREKVADVHTFNPIYNDWKHEKEVLTDLILLYDKSKADVDEIISLFEIISEGRVGLTVAVQPYDLEQAVDSGPPKVAALSALVLDALKELPDRDLRNASLLRLAKLKNWREAYEAIDPKTDDTLRSLSKMPFYRINAQIEFLESISDKTLNDYRCLIELYSRQGEYQKVLGLFQPTSPSVLDPKKSLALRASDDFKFVTLYLGYAYYKLRQFKEACEQFDLLDNLIATTGPTKTKPFRREDVKRNLFSEHGDVHPLDIVRAYIAAGRYQDAKKRIEFLDKFINRRGEFHFLLGQIYFKSNDLENANAHFWEAHSRVCSGDVAIGDVRALQNIFDLGKYLPLTFKVWAPLINLIPPSSNVLIEIAHYFHELYYRSDKKSREIITEIYFKTKLRETKILDLQFYDVHFSSLWFDSKKMDLAQKNIYANVSLLQKSRPAFEVTQLNTNIVRLVNPEALRHYYRLAIAKDEVGVRVFDFLSDKWSSEIPKEVEENARVYALLYMAAYSSQKPSEMRDTKAPDSSLAMQKLKLLSDAFDKAMNVSAKTCCAAVVSLALNQELPQNFLELGLKNILLANQAEFLKALHSELPKNHESLPALCKDTLRIIQELENGGKNPEKIESNSDFLTPIRDFVNEHSRQSSAPPENAEELSPITDPVNPQGVMLVPTAPSEKEMPEEFPTVPQAMTLGNSHGVMPAPTAPMREEMPEEFHPVPQAVDLENSSAAMPSATASAEEKNVEVCKTWVSKIDEIAVIHKIKPHKPVISKLDTFISDTSSTEHSSDGDSIEDETKEFSELGSTISESSSTEYSIDDEDASEESSESEAILRSTENSRHDENSEENVSEQSSKKSEEKSEREQLKEEFEKMRQANAALQQQVAEQAQEIEKRDAKLEKERQAQEKAIKERDARIAALNSKALLFSNPARPQKKVTRRRNSDPELVLPTASKK